MKQLKHYSQGLALLKDKQVIQAKFMSLKKNQGIILLIRENKKNTKAIKGNLLSQHLISNMIWKEVKARKLENKILLLRGLRLT